MNEGLGELRVSQTLFYILLEKFSDGKHHKPGTLF